MDANAGISGLCKSLKSPVPMDMGIPMIIHSLTPIKTKNPVVTKKEKRIILYRYSMQTGLTIDTVHLTMKGSIK